LLQGAVQPHLPIVQDDPELHRRGGLQRAQGVDRGCDGLGLGDVHRPVGEIAIAKILVDVSLRLLDALLARQHPFADHLRQFILRHRLAHLGEMADVGHEQPAHPRLRRLLGGGNGHHRLLALGVLRLTGTKNQAGGGNLDAVVVLELRGHAHALAVENGAVSAAKVHEVVTAIALCMNDGVPARNLGVVNGQRVLRQATNRAGALQRELLPCIRFQPIVHSSFTLAVPATRKTPYS
jgi:hypothetical protein